MGFLAVKKHGPCPLPTQDSAPLSISHAPGCWLHTRAPLSPPHTTQALAAPHVSNGSCRAKAGEHVGSSGSELPAPAPFPDLLTPSCCSHAGLELIGSGSWLWHRACGWSLQPRSMLGCVLAVPSLCPTFWLPLSSPDTGGQQGASTFASEYNPLLLQSHCRTPKSRAGCF